MHALPHATSFPLSETTPLLPAHDIVAQDLHINPQIGPDPGGGGGAGVEYPGTKGNLKPNFLDGPEVNPLGSGNINGVGPFDPSAGQDSAEFPTGNT